MVRMPAYRAVITGIGCVSPFGVGGYDLVANVLKANVSAIQPLTSFPTAGLPSCLGAEIPVAYLPETEEGRRWSRLSQMTVLACRQAVAEAGLCDSAALCQAGLVVGSQFGDLRSTEAFCLGFLRKGLLGLSPLLFPSTVMNAMAGMTSIALGLKGPMLTLNQSGLAGELAVARALALLRAGRASAVIACGVDELFPLLYETLVQLRVPSPRGCGAEACRPFDQRHNGPILGRELRQWCLNYLSMHRREGPRCWPRYGVPAGEVSRPAQAISPYCVRGNIRYSTRLWPKLPCILKMLAWPICRAAGIRSMTPWNWHV